MVQTRITDFGSTLIPALYKEYPVYVYESNNMFAITSLHKRQMADVGTLDSFFEANMDLVRTHC
jgi:glucose-1-phosphate adenylyltransferase